MTPETRVALRMWLVMGIWAVRAGAPRAIWRLVVGTWLGMWVLVGAWLGMWWFVVARLGMSVLVVGARVGRWRVVARAGMWVRGA